MHRHSQTDKSIAKQAQTQLDRHRHCQEDTDTVRQRQTQPGRHRHSQTVTDTIRQTQTDRHRHTLQTDRHPSRQTKTQCDRLR